MEQFSGADPADLAASLEHAAAMAKWLSIATDPSHLQQIYNSLAAAQRHLSSFLPFQNPNLPQPPPEEDSDESAINGNAEPMQVGDEDGEVVRSSAAMMMDEVEAKMRDHFFIRNKRPKRAMSPSSAAEAERRRLHRNEDRIGSSSSSSRYDPNATRGTVPQMQPIRASPQPPFTGSKYVTHISLQLILKNISVLNPSKLLKPPQPNFFQGISSSGAKCRKQ